MRSSYGTYARPEGASLLHSPGLAGVMSGHFEHPGWGCLFAIPHVQLVDCVEVKIVFRSLLGV